MSLVPTPRPEMKRRREYLPGQTLRRQGAANETVLMDRLRPEMYTEYTMAACGLESQVTGHRHPSPRLGEIAF